ncbi:hypothetical protein I4F81_010636 [Pyropia yezoensis]|uniref:Uncharacterized protein n=1 Tax=Pyropia yezoensis TaxID=2788 RepID=A0ACC3CCZ0_PYRYE|nr:hypothetical protein I4F81_010636 [Neopyropia yezoensis]
MVEVWQIVVVIICVFLSGAFSGLTLGLLSLDLVDLAVLVESGTPKEVKCARRILPVRKHGNFLLCTLLVGNTAVNSALSIVTSDLFGGWAGFLASTLVILYLGEIVPQSVCFSYGLTIGAHAIPFVKLAMLLTSPLSYPTSRLLDWALGGEQAVRYNKSQLKSLVNLHGEQAGDGGERGGANEDGSGDGPGSEGDGGGENGDGSGGDGVIGEGGIQVGGNLADGPVRVKAKKRGRSHKAPKQPKKPSTLSKDETTILRGALDFATKNVLDVMTPLKKVVMLEESTRLSFKNLMVIFHSGHSRVPVYSGDRTNIVGMIFAKDLILLDPDDNVPVKTMLEFFDREVRHVASRTPLDRMLRDIKSSRCHMAVVRDVGHTGDGGVTHGFVTASVGHPIGVLTLEDVLEELVGEIVDETDVYADNLSSTVIRRRHMDPDVLRLLHVGTSPEEEHLSPKEILVVASYLAHHVPEFGPDFVSEAALQSLLATAPMLSLSEPWAEEGGSDAGTEAGGAVGVGNGVNGVGSGANHTVVEMSPIGAGPRVAPPVCSARGTLLYQRGVATKDALLIINGSMEIVAGAEAFVSAAGPWTLLAGSALTDSLYAPDFTARVTEFPLRALRIPRKIYKAMMRGSVSGGSAGSRPITPGPAGKVGGVVRPDTTPRSSPRVRPLSGYSPARSGALPPPSPDVPLLRASDSDVSSDEEGRPPGAPSGASSSGEQLQPTCR